MAYSDGVTKLVARGELLDVNLPLENLLYDYSMPWVRVQQIFV